MFTNSPQTPDRITISIYAARKALKSATALDALIDRLDDLSKESIEGLGPLVFDVLRLGPEFPAADILDRMLKKRPEWALLKNEKGSTLLLEVLNYNHFDMLDILLSAGADPMCVNQAGFSVLDAAANAQADPQTQERYGETLLRSGDFTPSQKDTALYRSVFNANAGMIKSLLAHGANPGTPFRKKKTALSLACSLTESRTHGLDIVQAFLQSPGIHEIINKGWGIVEASSLMHYAARAGNVRVMSMLMDAGARVDPPDDLQLVGCNTPLMEAAYFLRLEAIDLLINSGCHANDIDHYGRNALHHLALHTFREDPYAIQPARLKALALLVDAGADPMKKNNDDQTPLDCAIAGKDPAATEAFKTLYAQTSSRHLSRNTPHPDAHRSPSARRL